MGALTIAFDTTIVGALALPWVLLVLHLFFFDNDRDLGLIAWFKTNVGTDWLDSKSVIAVAGILLFAVAYTLGSAVERLAQDFFNDDDVHFQIGPWMVRQGLTEDRIIAKVYCAAEASGLLRKDSPTTPVGDKIRVLEGQIGTVKWGCGHVLSWLGRHQYKKQDYDLIGTAVDIFSLQENHVLLEGEDYTLRLRQVHDQIVVLRGAAFNGLVALAFCLFAWGARARRDKAQRLWWLALALFPVLLLGLGGVAASNHFPGSSDAPCLEFTFVALGACGAWLVWRRAADAPGPHAKRPRLLGNWPALSLLSALLTVAAILGWWATEQMYGEQVIYAYDSQISGQ